MFNKDVEITIMTKFENKDNFRIERLCESFKNSGTKLIINGLADKENVEIKFITSKSCVKKLKEYLNVLNFVGIEGKMEIK